jgi:hypothetical protein
MEAAALCCLFEGLGTGDWGLGIGDWGLFENSPLSPALRVGLRHRKRNWRYIPLIPLISPAPFHAHSESQS